MIHAFADCELDDRLFQLRCRGRAVEVEPKIFDVLSYLLEHRDRVVSKDELLDALWPGLSVSDSVLPHCIALARRAVGDDRRSRRIIATLHGRGYRFVAPVEQRDPESLSQVGGETPPLVGRAAAMDRLLAGLSGALTGHGRLVLVVGEPGIGKTRVAEEVAGEARRRGASVLVGRCHEGDGAPAFWPWVQVLRAAVGDEDARLADHLGPGAIEIAELVPELRTRLHGLPRSDRSAGEQARFRLFDSVSLFLKRRAQQRASAILLEDLHWADEASLRLLDFVARGLADARLLMIATYRDVELRRGHPLGDLLVAVARERVCERITLRGLDEAETGRLVEATIGGKPSPELVQPLHEMTDGNPFFIQEIVRLLATQHPPASAGDLRVSALELPQSVRAAIGRRLDTLSSECNSLLRVGSVLGRDFNVRLLARVAGRAADRVLARLDEAVSARVLDVCEDGLGRYAFHHALIRHTLYDELSVAERLRLHRRVGEALEEANGAGAEAHLAELAHHFFTAAPGGDAERAVALCTRAAEQAYRLLAYEESARQYERALEAAALAALDGTRRCEVLLGLGEARSALGARERACDAFVAAAGAARGLGRADFLARAALGCRGPEKGTPAEAATLALLEEALAGLGEGDLALRARLLGALVGTPPHANSMERRVELARESYRLACRSGDGVAIRDALWARLWACLGPDHVEERLAVARETLTLAQRTGDRQTALLGHDALLGAHLLLGDLANADRALADYTRVAEELRQPAFLFQATFARGSRALAHGELDAAERLFREALDRGRGSVPYAHFMLTGQMVTLGYQRSPVDPPELESLFGEMLALPYAWEKAIRPTLIYYQVQRGELEHARREFEGLAARDFTDIVRDEHWLSAMGGCSNAALLLGDRSRAALLYDLLAPYAELFRVHDLLRSVQGSVASRLGELATFLGRHEEAEAHFERAIAKEAAMKARLALMDTKTAYACLLFVRGRTGDRRRAQELLREVESGRLAIGSARVPPELVEARRLAAAPPPSRGRGARS